MLQQVTKYLHSMCEFVNCKSRGAFVLFHSSQLSSEPLPFADFSADVVVPVQVDVGTGFMFLISAAWLVMKPPFALLQRDCKILRLFRKAPV